MQDPVADVLDERAALGNGMAWSILASAVLHASLIGGGIVAARLHPAATTTPFISIRFSALAPEAPALGTVSAPATKPAEKPALAPTPAIERPITPAQKPVEKPKPSSKTVPFSPFGKSTMKGEEKGGASPATAPVTSSAGALPGLPAVGSAGVTGLEGGDFPYTIYIDRMRTLIGVKWYRPQVTQDLLTRVYFVINRDGSITDAKIESESGNGTFDRAALRAVLEVSPLPPLPFGYNGTYLGVHLTFH
jgi:TonB family protein